MVERGVLYQRQHNTEGCDVASIAPLLNLVSRLCRSQRSETLDAIFKHCDFSTIEKQHYIFVRAFGSPVPSLLKVSWQQLGACRKGVHRKLWFNSRRNTHIQICSWCPNSGRAHGLVVWKCQRIPTKVALSDWPKDEVFEWELT